MTMDKDLLEEITKCAVTGSARINVNAADVLELIKGNNSLRIAEALERIADAFISLTFRTIDADQPLDSGEKV